MQQNDLLLIVAKASMFPEKQPKSKIIFTNPRYCWRPRQQYKFSPSQNTNSLLQMSYDRSDTVLGKVSLLNFININSLLPK